MNLTTVRPLSRLAVVLVIAQLPVTVAATNVRIIVLATDLAPVGLPDQHFGFVGTPSINAIGEVTFASYLVNGSGLTYDSIWTEASDNGLHLVARQGLPPSDISDGTTFSNFLPQFGNITLSKK